MMMMQVVMRVGLANENDVRDHTGDGTKDNDDNDDEIRDSDDKVSVNGDEVGNDDYTD